MLLSFGYSVNTSSNDINSQNGLADSQWPRWRGNNQGTGLSPFNTSFVDGIEKWNLTLDGDVISSPVIGPDGTIYICSNNTIHAIENKKEKLTILNTGIYQYHQSGKFTLRGGLQNFKSKSQNDVLDKMKENIDKNYITTETYKPLSLKESMIKLDYKIEDTNKFMKQKKKIGINQNTKRIWDKKFKTNRQALNEFVKSKPKTL